MIKKYAQSNEEEFIIKYLDINQPDKYVDIGAGDPITISNTYMLYQKGWFGLCVEPYANLERWQKFRPRDILVQNFVLDKEGDINCIGGVVEGSDAYNYYKNVGGIVSKHHVISFEQLMFKYPEFNNCSLFSMDVECCEERILSVINFEIFIPKLMVIEYIFNKTDYRPKWEKYILPWYNKVESTSSNQFYLKKSL